MLLIHSLNDTTPILASLTRRLMVRMDCKGEIQIALLRNVLLLDARCAPVIHSCRLPKGNVWTMRSQMSSMALSD